jgi:5-methylcytosine-specific restriction endonuclease McrA
MIHRPRPHVKLTRREVFRRDNYTCQYCGKHTLTLTIDHIIPRHLGGQQRWTNVVAACPMCNHRKGGRTLEEVNMNLLRTPIEPPTSAVYIFGRHLKEYNEWEPFLNGW